jgi:hypothetical protein
MYAKTRGPGGESGESGGNNATISSSSHHESSGAPKPDSSSKDSAPSKSTTSTPLAGTARAELNLLADLLGRVADDTMESKPIKLTLFAEDPFCGFGSNTSNVVQTQTVVVDASKSRKANAVEMMSKLGMNDIEGEESKGKDDDLLDLMDSVGK